MHLHIFENDASGVASTITFVKRAIAAGPRVPIQSSQLRLALGRTKENKYVLPEESAGYYAQGSAVIYYQHKARYKNEHYTKQLEKLLIREDLPGASGLALKFEKVSQRYCMFLIQPKHREAVEKAVKDMLSTDWGYHFRLL